MKSILIILLILLVACIDSSPEYQTYKKNIGKTVKLDMFKTVIFQGDTIQFADFRKKYKFISLVYLQDNCNPCYNKYINWHKKMKYFLNENYSILFIVNEKYSTEFLKKVNQIEPIQEKYYIRMDPNATFIKENSNIPKWIIENTLLIDNMNKILLIGEPFYNAKQEKIFQTIIKSGSKKK